jgi:hypothetical protein
MQDQGVDLVLAERARLHRAGGTDEVAGTRQGTGAQAGADVDRGDPAVGDPLRVENDEVGVAVAIGVVALDVDDPADGFAAARQPGGAVRGCNRFNRFRPGGRGLRAFTAAGQGQQAEKAEQLSHRRNLAPFEASEGGTVNTIEVTVAKADPTARCP